MKDLAYLSTGEKFKNINKSKEVRRLNRKLKRLQRQLSRKYIRLKQEKSFQKGEKLKKSNNIIKLEHKLKLLWRKIVHIRNNYNHHLTSYVIKKLPYKVVIEDLNIRGMMKNKYLAKAVGEQNFFEIRRQLEYKCKFNGIQLIIADRWYPSSKTCSCCGNIKTDLKLSDRTYKCEKCSLIMNRDLNASINLANYTQVS